MRIPGRRRAAGDRLPSSLASPTVSPIATLVCTAGGIAVIVLAGRDIFDALFHPEGRGSFSRLLSRSVWRVFRVLGIEALLTG